MRRLRRPDGDGYGQGTACDGADCNDHDAACSAYGDPCCDLPCSDNDLDGYGLGDCLGVDCNDEDPACSSPGDACCTPGVGTCGELVSCADPCNENLPCVQRCLEGADAEAQLRFGALLDCVRATGCALDNVNCFLFQCSQPLQACMQDQ